MIRGNSIEHNKQRIKHELGSEIVNLKSIPFKICYGFILKVN